LLLVSIASPAAAQEGDDAAGLFERGLQQMLDGDYAAGCPNLAQSYELEPLAGVVFTLAECYAKWEKLATALEHYDEYLGLAAALPEDKRARQAERIRVATDQQTALELKVPALTLVLPEDAPAGTIVRLDGKELLSSEISITHRLEPGVHDVIVLRPTGESRSYQEDLAEGDRRSLRLELPVIPEEPKPRPSDSLGPMHIGALVAGGIGVAGLVVGSITGAMALGERDAIEENCVDTQCNQTGLDAADSGQTVAAVSTAGFVIGGLGLAAGAVLWFTAPSDGPASEDSEPSTSAAIGAAMGPQGATMRLRVTW